MYWSIQECTGVYRSVLGYTGVYWDILECTGIYWSVLGYTGVYWTILGMYWSLLEYTGVYLFHNECSDAMFFGSHVSFSIDDENVGIWSVSDPELTAIENIVVA